MPTIDELMKQVDRERSVVRNYQKMANESNNDDLRSLLLSVAKQEENLAAKMQDKINHLLEVEKW